MKLIDEKAKCGRCCAYCGNSSAPMTREHLFPAAIDKAFSSDGESVENPYWMNRLKKKIVGKAPTVKDVCRDCNNGPLSLLDAYGLNLYQKKFYKIAEDGDVSVLEYSYDKLLRWLLKLNFNSARIDVAADLSEIKKLRAYIIGQKRRPKRVALFLTLIRRDKISDQAIAEAFQNGVHMPSTDDPDMLRIGRFYIDKAGWNPEVARTAFFQSYFFSVIVISDKKPASELGRLTSMFGAVWPHAVLLNPAQNRVSVRASVPAMETFYSHVLSNLDFYSQGEIDFPGNC